MTKKLMVIGIDGADFSFLEPWILQGDLPGFGALIERGVHAPLASSLPPLSPVAWTSIATGVNPGKHGVYDFLLKKTPAGDRSPEFELATGGHRRSRAFWEILSEYGRSSVIVNMPCSFPPDPIKGAMISGWDGAPQREKCFYPTGLYREIADKFGDYYFAPINLIPRKVVGRSDNDSRKQKLQAILVMTRHRRKILLHLARHRPWDTFFGVFTESDNIQHIFFDSLYPVALSGGPVFQVYQEIDLFLQDILKEYGSDADIMVVSDHGFGPLTAGVDLTLFLEQQGWLERKRMSPGALVYSFLRHSPRTKRFLRSIAHNHWFPKPAKGVKPRHLPLDFARSELYFEGMYPFFYLLRRENEEAIFRELREKLISLRYQDKPVFRDLLACRDVYHGRYVDRLPDFIGLINDGFEVAGLEDFMRPGADRRSVFRDHLWNGNHQDTGVYIFSRGGGGAGVEPAPTVFDIAPSVLAHQGVPVPREMDGRPLVGPSGPGGVEFSEYRIDKSASLPGLSAEHNEAVRERLRALGYL